MKVIFALLCLMRFQYVSSQSNEYKVDSVFKFYFFIFEMETTNCCPHDKYPSYYDSIILKKTNDTLYFNKYVSGAADFIQKISKIKSPLIDYENTGFYLNAVNTEMVKKWKDWYDINRKRLRWSKKKNRPVIR